MFITKKNIIFNVSLFVIYIVISIITYIVVKDFLHVFLVWNLFLALIPFGLMVLIDKKIVRNKIGIVIVLLLWLFFFPNTMYIITDLIYTNIDNFMNSPGPYESLIYAQDISAYLALFHIYLGGFIGVIYGIKSLQILYSYSKTFKFGKYRDIGFVVIFILSALAIYIGRFLRYNSWDVLRVFSIIKNLFLDFSWFTVFFIFSLTFVQVIIFYSIKNNFMPKK